MTGCRSASFFCFVLSLAMVSQVTAQEVSADNILDVLVRLEPGQLVQRLAEMKIEAASAEAESTRLREQAAMLEGKVAGIQGSIESIRTRFAALDSFFHPPAAPSEPSMVAAADPAMAPPPETPPTALAAAGPTVNFTDHIKPILAARCLNCHNTNKRRSGLSLETIAAILEGGSSGPVLVPGDPGASRLIRLIAGEEEPVMPPTGDPIDPASIDLIRSWISQGAPESKDSAVLVKAEEAASNAPVFVAAAFSDGPPPMPEVLLPPATTALGQRGVVGRALAASPRSPLVAVGGHHEVLLFNLQTRTWLGALPFAEGDLYTLSFSVNGELLLAAGGLDGKSGAVALWKVRTGERIATFDEPYEVVLAADVSPDHRFVVYGGPNRVVTVCSLMDGKQMYQLTEHTDWVYAAKFTPDGELLATADRAGGLLLWQAANGRPVEALKGHEGAVHSLAYSPDSVILASSGQDGTVQLWDTWQYTRIRSFPAHTGAVLSVEFTPDSQILTTGVDRQTKRWDTNGTTLHTYSALSDWGYRTCYAPSESMVVSGDWKGMVEMWKVDGSVPEIQITTAPSGAEQAAPKVDVALASQETP